MTSDEQRHPMSLCDRCEQIARELHGGEMRRDGVTPYTHHLASVARMTGDEPTLARCLAWLHDTLENTDCSPSDLEQAGVPCWLIDELMVLTHLPDEPYDSYIDRVLAGSPRVQAVKLFDMIDNLTDAPSLGQLAKYSRNAPRIIRALTQEHL